MAEMGIILAALFLAAAAVALLPVAEMVTL